MTQTIDGLLVGRGIRRAGNSAKRALFTTPRPGRGYFAKPGVVLAYPGAEPSLASCWSCTGGTAEEDPGRYVFGYGESPVGYKVTKETGNDAVTAVHEPVAALDPRPNTWAWNDGPTGCFLRFHVYLHEGEGASSWTHIRELRVTLSSGTPSLYWTIDGYALRAGWNCFTVSPTSGTQAGGTFDWTSIHTVSLTAYGRSDGDNDETFAFTVGGVEFLPAPDMDVARIAVTYDGTSPDLREELAYWAQNGIRATLYVTPSLVDGEGMLSLADLRILSQTGHLIANGGYEGLQPIGDGLTERGLKGDIEQAAAWLASNGFTAGARHYAVPGGTSEWNRALEDSVSGSACDSIRLADGMPPVTLPHAPVLPAVEASDIAAMRTQIANAVADRGVLLLRFAGREADGYEWSDLEDVVADVVTAMEGDTADPRTIDELLIA